MLYNIKSRSLYNNTTNFLTTFAEINAALEVFDYHKAKDLLAEMKRRKNEPGI